MTTIDLVVDTRALGWTGIGTYLEQVLPHLPDDRRIVAVATPGQDVSGLDFQPSRVRNIYLPPIDAITRLANVDITTWWVPHYAGYPNGGRRQVVTVHDLVHVHDPAQSIPAWKRAHARRRLRASVRRADTMLVPSHATKRALASFAPMVADRVRVTPLSAGPAWRREPTRRDQRRNRLVHVSTGNAHKDVATMLAGWERVLVTHPQVELVIRSSTPLRDPSARARLRQLHATGAPVRVISERLPTEELVDLVATSLVALCPSLEEGFGLPVVEAMSAGTPVVASSIDAHREIGGDAVSWAAPRDADAWALAIQQLLDDHELWESRVAEGTGQAMALSDEQLVATTLDTLLPD